MQKSFTITQYPLENFRRILTKTRSKLFSWVFMDRAFTKILVPLIAVVLLSGVAKGQIVVLQDYQNHVSAPIGTFQGINFREGGLSGLYAIPNTNGKEYWTVTDRGVNVDAANANPAACRPTYDKIYGFPGYAPKIHRIRLHGDSLQILKSITLKRPSGATATGLINPAGFGSTSAELAE